MGQETTNAKTTVGRARGRVIVLTIVAVFSVVLGGSGFVRMARMTATSRDGAIREQALQCARTGLTAAINWMRRQPTQPVLVFSPTAVDSTDPRIGMVREFPFTDRLWGRFEVWRGDAAPDGLGVEDVSREAGHVSRGMVWRLRSVGFVFAREHADEPFDRRSSAVLYREVLEVDVARLGLRLPGQAALCVRDGETLVVGSRTRIDGGGAAAAIYSGPADVGAGPIAEVATGVLRGARGAVAATTADRYDDRVPTVFGVDRRTLYTMADACVTDVDHFPPSIPANSIYCVEAPRLACTPVHPLRGSGILFVKGDLSIELGSAVQFGGLVYVDGDLSVRSKVSFTGAVVVTGAVNIQGGREPAEFIYDDGILHRLCGAVGTYRMATPITRLEYGSERESELGVGEGRK